MQSLQSQAMVILATPAPPAPWKEPEYRGTLVYVRCLQDKAVPAYVQDMMIEKSQAKWLVKNIEASHNPHLSRPKELATLVI